ncbi:hypothetical protein B0H14DRAFT_2674111 [Mycena olivaceomarginata]|nr:hypothetical protein B0H14DRAFT_2674111 [Mycena olivaceomarginata]
MFWWTKVRGQSSLGFRLALAVDSHGRRHVVAPSARSRAICARTVHRTWRACASCCDAYAAHAPGALPFHPRAAQLSVPHSSCACSAPPRPSPTSS